MPRYRKVHTIPALAHFNRFLCAGSRNNTMQEISGTDTIRISATYTALKVTLYFVNGSNHPTP